MHKSRAVFNSISTKLLLLITIGTFVLATALVAISIALTSKILTKGAATQMNLSVRSAATISIRNF